MIQQEAQQEPQQEVPSSTVITDEISKSFGSGDDVIHALRSISIAISAGKLTMIIGPSGCGKTTLLSAIAGTLKPDAGTLHVLGHNLTQMSDKELTLFRSIHIGFIFQQFHLIHTLTCAENVAIPLLIQGMERKRAFEKAIEALSLVGIADRAWRRPKQLSGGQQQRVAIARAIVHSPSLVICDEPTSALDFENGTKVMKILESIAHDSKKTVIVVTHDHRIFSYAEKIIEMDDGAVKSVKTQTPHTITGADHMGATGLEAHHG